jgi:adenine-specific DNA glycosylase
VHDETKLLKKEGAFPASVTDKTATIKNKRRYSTRLCPLRGPCPFRVFKDFFNFMGISANKKPRRQNFFGNPVTSLAFDPQA